MAQMLTGNGRTGLEPRLRTREHYDVSRAIGELKLPAARELPPGAVLVAAGMWCCHQIAHFTGVRALHPAVLLRSLMEPR